MARWNPTNLSTEDEEFRYTASYNPYMNMRAPFYPTAPPPNNAFQTGYENLSVGSIYARSYSDVPGTSNAISVSQYDSVRNSNLTATAKEFKPGGDYLSSDTIEVVPSSSNQSNNKNTGALKKTNYRDKPNKKYDNRNYVHSKQNDARRNGRFRNNFTVDRSKEEQSKTLKEAAEFLQKINQNASSSDVPTQNIESFEERSNFIYKQNADRNKHNVDRNKQDADRNKQDADRNRQDVGRNRKAPNKNKDHVSSNQRYKNDFYRKSKFEYGYDKATAKGNSKTYYGKNNKSEDGIKEVCNNYSTSSHFGNWRNPTNRDYYAFKKADTGSQRERLEQMIAQKKLDCLVCCERIQSVQKIWSCKQCYHILHFDCTVRWACSSVKSDTGWRCPACQNVKEAVPTEDHCYCDKITNPRHKEGTLPHSCGDVCDRTLRNCEHKCPIICHPGPCPDCTLTVSRLCGCGRTSATVKCSSSVDVKCSEICDKPLKCGQHFCKTACHSSECKLCEETIEQTCFCGKITRNVECSEEVKGARHFECGDVCGKPLTCGNHTCPQLCHVGECNQCNFAPDQVQSCPCGRSPLNLDRASCLDPIACCDEICMKTLKCGHECKEVCHIGPCPECKLSSLVRCRCGHMDMEISCTEFIALGGDARCKKKCNKKLLCGKHRCKELCCIDQEHRCVLLCNRQLSCGLHRCTLTCHSYRCPPCSVASFEELYCECGGSVSYPPVPCGAKPPSCSRPCSRNKICGHEINHTCHTGPCPPCTVLSVRWCYGRHEKRATIPCYQQDFSCGLPCKQKMPCGRHTCIQPCHAGLCPVPCTQPCTELRSTCGHPCNVPCHEPPCPETACKQTVRVTCQCGLRASTRPCMELAGEYQSIAVAQLASKMAELQNGHTVDISDIVSNQRKTGTLKTLECNEECRKVERNRRLAIGLQIRNPDLTAKLTPRYSDYMRNWAKKDARFCQNVHDKLTELVQLAKESKQKSRSYSFDSMNRDKRHLIHEYCEHFGCDSEAYDQEPNRNVVATAFRDKSWLPSVSLLELIQRENGQRKVPGPMLSKGVSTNKSESVSLRLPGRVARPATPPSEFVDYFNNPPL